MTKICTCMIFFLMRSSPGADASSDSAVKLLACARRARSQLEKAYPSIVDVGFGRVIWHE